MNLNARDQHLVSEKVIKSVIKSVISDTLIDLKESNSLEILKTFFEVKNLSKYGLTDNVQ